VPHDSLAERAATAAATKTRPLLPGSATRTMTPLQKAPINHADATQIDRVNRP
jgi:hypothetical protein